jgi:hypothetical protein
LVVPRSIPMTLPMSKLLPSRYQRLNKPDVLFVAEN